MDLMEGNLLMNKKQIIGLVVAGAVFAFVGAISVFTNTLANSIASKNEAKESIESMLTTNDVSLPSEDFVGVVDVEGTIMNTSESQGLFSTPASYNHERTLNYIDSMIDAPNNKGIILYVNSPGGGVYESDELYLKLKEYKEKAKKIINVEQNFTGQFGKLITQETGILMDYSILKYDGRQIIGSEIADKVKKEAF